MNTKQTHHNAQGIDDALGLLLSLSDPSTNVLAVSSVFGNAGAQQVLMRCFCFLQLNLQLCLHHVGA
jgi:inosine-uridine nucleoside N-ribohydrolase